MTAEIAVMNKSAIALAADSKVTITNDTNAKGYDSVNKLFALSKRHPIAVMVYGNAEFMGVPWEVIIKEFRHRCDEPRDTIQEVGTAFRNFIENEIPLFDDESRKRNLGQVVASIMAETLSEARIVALETQHEIGSAEFLDAMREHIELRAEEALDAEPWMTKDEFDDFNERFRDVCIAGVAHSIDALFNESLVKGCLKLVMVSLLSEQLSPRQSGIVIAGYGENEYFPSLVEFSTDGFIGDRIKIIDRPSVDIDRNYTSCVRAFAQRDMVQRFMNGCDASLFQSLMMGFHEVLHAGIHGALEKEGIFSKLGAKAKAKKEEAIDEKIQEAIQQFIDDCDDHMRRAYSRPIIQMVSLLPKEELAALAESLVSLTSLKRRVSAEQETVGGPIDVALVSKRDGFVWIKRKHYFNRELNHHFFSNYFQKGLES